ncbi:dolichyl-phosphate beta-glucosyltransferase [Winogradskyella wandonensis]|uniref:Dolichyl-phosphate beta-glucosyltransferase n=1 Tax=Winogradskyella wandonensis TaxID=1442586 RepID=A0A4R1KTL3_9FLAO|nr:glycosyltransferase [Winogradskyella wandonensis]TCK68516.1 dolichyl-phosphate beta-glucosyltransferase [Winogradskyella wandonensis]
MQPKLSLVIPIYNAGVFIEDSIQRLKDWMIEQDYLIEVILVNDGSTDNTELLLKKNIGKSDCLALISYSSNKGKGHAVKQGMLKAKGKYRVFTDADIPYGFKKINEILGHFDSNNFDVCIGSRVEKASKYRVKSSFFRTISSKVFTFFITKFVIDKVGDTQCGLKGFTAQTAENIFSKLKISGFAFDVETIYLCSKYNLRIKRIPVQFEGNTISTINLFSSSFRMFFDVLSLPIRYHILKAYSKV